LDNDGQEAGMRVVVVWWELDRSEQTIDSMRDYVRNESVDSFAGVHGLRLKIWLTDREANRWGAVYLWESSEAAAQPLPSRAPELIGYPPTHRLTFDVEATVEGMFTEANLSRLGAAFA
jgi:hypothetical protein